MILRFVFTIVVFTLILDFLFVHTVLICLQVNVANQLPVKTVSVETIIVVW